MWDLESGSTIRTLEGHTNWVSAVALTPDGRRAVSASHDGTLRVWDLEDGRYLVTFTTDDALAACAVATLQKFLAAGQTGQVFVVRLIDSDTPYKGRIEIRFLL